MIVKRLAPLAAASALLVFGVADPAARGDEPIHLGDPVTVYKTVTIRVPSTFHGHSAGYWSLRNTQHIRERNSAQKVAQKMAGRIRGMRADLARHFQPDVTTALAIARVVYGVDETGRARCESTFDPFNVNQKSGASGLLQFLPSTWRTTPYAGLSIFDPYASALAGGWMVRVGRSGEWSCGL